MTAQSNQADNDTHRSAKVSMNRNLSNEIKLTHLKELIIHAGRFLPTQAPITQFVSLNTLAAFEEMPFDEGVVKAGQIFGCQPYLSEDRYRAEFKKGRIQLRDLREILKRDLKDQTAVKIDQSCTRFDLRLAMLQYPLRSGPATELHWFVAETDALTKFRDDVAVLVQQQFINETRHWVMRDLFDGQAEEASTAQGSRKRRAQQLFADLLEHYDSSQIENWDDETWAAVSLQALWRICRNGVHGLKASAPKKVNATRHRDLILFGTKEDSDRLVHEIVIRYTGAFLDQGFSPWVLPVRELGYFKGFCALYGQPAGQPDPWMRGLTVELQAYQARNITPLESIQESLVDLGVPEEEWEAFITATLLGLPGWAGMLREVEVRADRSIIPVPVGSSIEYLAVYLILERRALKYVARRTLKYDGPLSGLREAALSALPEPGDNSLEQRAFIVFQLAQVMGWLPTKLYQWSKADWANLIMEIESFSEMDRRRLFQHAYERRYYMQSLDAFAICAARPLRQMDRPSFQAVFCIDDREESIRRHLEEVAPECETLSAAGFYCVAMYYRGSADAHYMPLCPVVMIPKHWVEEDVIFTEEDLHRRRAVTRKAIGKASHRVHLGSRTFAGGALLTAGFGVLASIPLVARVLFPRLTSRIRKAARKLVEPPRNTRLILERTEPTPGPEGGHVGFSLAEMIDISERMLRDTGLTVNLSRIVIWLGHGSSSMNNPHNAAYNCGACAGGEGGPNARALAQMLNDPRIREALAGRGIAVPEETMFVGGFHNTCDDSVIYYDLDRLPRTHQKEFATVQAQIEEACNRTAHERCRRFVSAPLNMSFAAARRHVEGRSEDLSQTRPEVGHSTTAITYVGRRERVRGLFMDRRAFLNSYDPTQDDEKSYILARVLSAAVPVTGGINLQYYFSYVDSRGWGCGSKLPHNVTGLLGVMDGPASDLRTGLPWQGVEIHEPVRCLFIIETTPEAMDHIMDENPVISRLCRNEWVQLVVLSPYSAELQIYRHGKWEIYQPETNELPEVNNSTEWYRGWRDNLGYALVKAAFPAPAAGGENGNGHAREYDGAQNGTLTDSSLNSISTLSSIEVEPENLLGAGLNRGNITESDRD